MIFKWSSVRNFDFVIFIAFFVFKLKNVNETYLLLAKLAKTIFFLTKRDTSDFSSRNIDSKFVLKKK